VGKVIYETSKPRFVVQENYIAPYSLTSIIEESWESVRGFDTEDEATEEADHLSRVNPGTNYRVVDTQD
jgi:hypothetical protein